MCILHNKGKRALSIIACLLTFVVMLILHNTGRNYHATRFPVPNIPDDTSLSDLLVSDSFKASVMNRTNADRKVLACNGMILQPPGGVVKRILLVSTFRSGSTFTGELLSMIPGVFYISEPFRYLAYTNIPIDNETRAAKYAHFLTQTHECNNGPLLAEFRDYNTLKNMGLNLNTAFQLCRQTESYEYCQNPDLLSFACRYFPIQVDKIIRMPLRYVVPFLHLPKHNYHVVLLVRDPRGTVASRRRQMWCLNECADRKSLCALLRDNHETAVRAMQEFPDTFTVLRYEDLALDPENVVAELFKRIGIPLTSGIRSYIEEHTGHDGSRITETTRQKGSRVALWKTSLPWEHIEETQKLCGDTLAKYGYLPVLNSNSINETDTVVPNWKIY